MEISFSLPTDSDGFLSQECPTCKRRFKVVLGDGSDQPIAYCPYCPHHGAGCWWTREQADYWTSVAVETAMMPRLNQMAKKFNSSTGSGLLTVRMGVKQSPKSPQPIEHDSEMPMYVFECCGEKIKHDGNGDTLNCIICGSAHQVAE